MSLDLDELFASTEPYGPEKRLVILSSGQGRDSATMVALLAEGKLEAGGRIVRPEDVDVVVFSDLGAEWEHTYRTLPTFKAILDRLGVPFVVLKKPPERLWGPVSAFRSKLWDQRASRMVPALKRIQEAKSAGRAPDPSDKALVATLNAEMRDAEARRFRPKLYEESKRLGAAYLAAKQEARRLTEERRQHPIRTPRGDRIRARLKAVRSQRDELEARWRHARKWAYEPVWLRPAWPSVEAKAAGGGYHRRPPLLESLMERARVATRSAECTFQHKIAPIQAFMVDWASRKFGMPGAAWRKAVEAGEYPPPQVLIGFAFEEASRVQRAQPPAWIEELYPLVEMGIGKDEETEVLERNGLNWIAKSGCRFCPYGGAGWFWALRETDPQVNPGATGKPGQWRRVLAMEQRAVGRNPKFRIKGGVVPLSVRVDAWRLANPTATPDEVFTGGYTRGCPTGVERPPKPRAEASRQLVLDLDALFA